MTTEHEYFAKTWEHVDLDWFRWIVLRDGLDALWAWVINKP